VLEQPPGHVTEAQDQLADQLREFAGAGFLYCSIQSLFPEADLIACKRFRDRLLADAGNPSDPIEVMMIEQVVLAHMNIGRLQARSASSESVEAAKAYGTLATQLMGEFRRTCLALQMFRLSARQLALAVPGVQAVANELNTGPDLVAAQARLDTKLVSTEAIDHDHGTVPFSAEEPQASRGRAAEYSTTQSALS
jgi:hypothetical protein